MATDASARTFALADGEHWVAHFRYDATKRNVAYVLLPGQLVSGRYRFGEPVLVKEVAEAAGASKAPIMSALRRLQTEGFVHITAQVGCRVVSPHAAEIGDFFLMFGRMEATLAAQRGSDSEVLGLAPAGAAAAP